MSLLDYIYQPPQQLRLSNPVIKDNDDGDDDNSDDYDDDNVHMLLIKRE